MKLIGKLLGAGCLMTLAACGAGFDQEQGSEVDRGQFGNATMHNSLVQTGQLSYTIALAERFSKEVTDTVTFPFNSAELTSEARSVLLQQANFIRQFPEVRFKVFGHTDLVGGDAYNRKLGQRRANAVVNFLVSQGISRSRLEAVVSYGKTRPLIQTNAPEERNRRTVTEVSGFVQKAPLVLNGKYAEVIWREYVTSGERPHPTAVSSQAEVQTGSGG